MAVEKCPFCNVADIQVIAASNRAIAIADSFPISQGHSLVIPKRHVSSIFEMTTHEQTEVWTFVAAVRQLLSQKFSPAGFNIGLNDGGDAGQTIEHAHIHVIPRYPGDIEDPRGGIRWVLPARAKYWD